MIFRARVIEKRIGSSHCVPMDLIVNHSLHRVTKNLQTQTNTLNTTETYQKKLLKSQSFYLVDIVNEHAEVCGFRVIPTQVRMTRLHTVIISFLDLLWRRIWKLLLKTERERER